MTDEQAEEASDSGVEEASPDLFMVVLQFRGTMDALRDLSLTIAPRVEELAKERATPQAVMKTLTLVSPLTTDKLATVFGTVAERIEHKQSGPSAAESPALPRQATPPSTTAAHHNEAATDTDVTSGKTREAADAVDAELPDEVQEALNDIVRTDPLALIQFSEALLRTMMGSPHRVLNSALLTVAVAAFETLLAGLVSQHYVRFPAAMDGGEPEFSLNELLTWDSIEDARETAVSHRVDAFMRKGLPEWSKWLDRTLKLPLDRAVPDVRQFNEVFQRRHLVVHAAGKVSRQYLTNTDFGDEPPPKLGTFLQVDDAYLVEALDLLDLAGSLIAVTAWVKWAADERESASARRAMSEYVYAHMDAGRWRIVEHFCDAAIPIAGTELSTRVLEVNRWLARKRLHGVNNIRAQVAAWDTSALSARFQLARLALLDDHDSALEMLSGLIQAGEITAHQAWDWPLFEELRAEPRFAEIVPPSDEASGTSPDAAETS